MAEKYDGWVIKSIWPGGSCLICWTFKRTRTEVINSWGRKNYKRQRRRGEFKAVKVKLVEVK